MTELSREAPHLSDDYAPLSNLIERALRRYGEFHAGTEDAETNLMMLEFANQIVDDIRAHPYRDMEVEYDYYQSLEDRVPIADTIMVNGLLAYFALQQLSEKAQVYVPQYTKTMNQQLWYLKNGNTQLQFRPTDGGSNASYASGTTTSKVNGTVSEIE